MSGHGVNFFLVGCERSGTTLLRLMLNEHPNITIPPESHFIVNLLERFGVDSILSCDELKEAFNILTNLKRWREWDNSEDELWSKLRELNSPNIRNVIDCAFQLKLDETGKNLWGDKTPKYSKYLGKIEIMYPEAKFIHITRDGRDVCLSFLKTGWIGPWVSRIALYWSDRVQSVIAAKLNKDKYLEIRYEDLVINTEATLKQICSFLKQEYSSLMVEYSSNLEKNVADRSLVHHQKLKRKPEINDINRWEKELGLQKTLVFESFAEVELNKYNYQRKFRYLGFVLYPATRLVINSLTKTAKFRHSLSLKDKTNQ